MALWGWGHQCCSSEYVAAALKQTENHILFVEPPICFSNLLKDFSRAGEKSKICLRPSNFFCLFIEICLSVAEAF
jgi:hypothetical protein